MLKEQQRAMKRIVSQHYQPAETRRRFRHDMKVQRRLLRERQKEEARRLKGSRHAHELRSKSN